MSPTVAVIGGGPAGATCAWRLAQAGIRTLLYERDPQREKPCGGGLTQRAFAALPELSQLGLSFSTITSWAMHGPRNSLVNLSLDPPIFIAPRRDLDGALRREAVKAGVALVVEPVRELRRREGGGWQINDHAADFVVGAGGMQDPLMRHLGLDFAASDKTIALGRQVTGEFPPTLITCFYPEQKGYVWWFPRRDHASFGIEIPHDIYRKENAQRLLNDFAVRFLPGIDVEHGEAYGWTAPMIRDWTHTRRPLGGSDWLLVGDAAGLVDATTGEGISYALASGVRAATAIVQGDLRLYERGLRATLIPELAKAARLHPKFYRKNYLVLAMWCNSRSRTLRNISNELAHGFQPYVTLQNRTLRNVPRILWEAFFKPAK